MRIIREFQCNPDTLHESQHVQLPHITTPKEFLFTDSLEVGVEVGGLGERIHFFFFLQKGGTGNSNCQMLVLFDQSIYT